MNARVTSLVTDRSGPAETMLVHFTSACRGRRRRQRTRIELDNLAAVGN